MTFFNCHYIFVRLLHADCHFYRPPYPKYMNANEHTLSSVLPLIFSFLSISSYSFNPFASPPPSFTLSDQYSSPMKLSSSSYPLIPPSLPSTSEHTCLPNPHNSVRTFSPSSITTKDVAAPLFPPPFILLFPHLSPPPSPTEDGKVMRIAVCGYSYSVYISSYLHSSIPLLHLLRPKMTY